MTPADNSSNNAFKAVNNYVAVDVETTGNDPASDSIVMLSAVRVVNGRSVGKIKSLVDPGTNRNSEAVAKLGLQQEMLAAAPKLPGILSAFFSFVGNDTLVGHDIETALAFVNDAGSRIFCRMLRNETIDTRAMSEILFPGEDAGFSALAERFLGGSAGKRADSKADMIAKCYEYMKRVNEKGIAAMPTHAPAAPIPPRQEPTVRQPMPTAEKQPMRTPAPQQ
ncbi:MAG: 3'-5' exonuclease, partial [Clostridia bacterium]|nr:3'-5' exonuclease [Clostridia bacterium]